LTGGRAVYQGLNLRLKLSKNERLRFIHEKDVTKEAVTRKRERESKGFATDGNARY